MWLVLRQSLKYSSQYIKQVNYTFSPSGAIYHLLMGHPGRHNKDLLSSIYIYIHPEAFTQ